jgi:predicted AlkP superfamily pyrophosphatase or phosphodiesterase
LNKVILVLCDGLRYDTAVANMGFLGHLVETKQASLFQVRGELPSLSRPMYETIHTGLPACVHGILSNRIVRRSNQPNIFQLARQAGLVTAAAAYSWFSELYNHAPYDRVDDREVDDPALTIQHGRFYTEDDTPDPEVFAAGAMLVKRFFSDYLLVHPMGMDLLGERYGGNSKEYRNHAIQQDGILAMLVPAWNALGYTLLVTSDHGMSEDGVHGGTTPEVRELPLFILPANGQGLGYTNKTVSQLQLAPTILKLLGVAPPATMSHQPIE